MATDDRYTNLEEEEEDHRSFANPPPKMEAQTRKRSIPRRDAKDNTLPDLFALVYSTKTKTFRLITQSQLILYKLLSPPPLVLPPPITFYSSGSLQRGELTEAARKKTLYLPLPALTRNLCLDFTWDDDPTHLEYVTRKVRLPVWVWVGRNLGVRRFRSVVVWRS